MESHLNSRMEHALNGNNMHDDSDDDDDDEFLDAEDNLSWQIECSNDGEIYQGQEKTCMYVSDQSNTSHLTNNVNNNNCESRIVTTTTTSASSSSSSSLTSTSPTTCMTVIADEKMIKEEVVNAMRMMDGDSNNDIDDYAMKATTMSIPTFHESIERMQHAVDVYLSNQFNRAIAMADEHAENSLYHACIKAFFLSFGALMSNNREQVKLANQAANKLMVLSHKCRKGSFLGLELSKWFWNSDYNKYTDAEIHAELCYAFSLMLTSSMQFLENQSLIGLVRMAFKIKSAYNSFNECMKMLSQKTNWESDKSKRTFESGVRAAQGIINLTISYFPKRLMNLIQIAGFKGAKREEGLENLHIAASQDTVYSKPCGILIMGYHCYAELILGYGPKNLTQLQRLIDDGLKQFPDGSWYLLFNGHLHFMQGDLDEAISIFTKCASVQTDFPELNLLCYWELHWLYALKCDWDPAIKYSRLVRLYGKWFPALHAFYEGCFLYEKWEQMNKRYNSKVTVDGDLDVGHKTNNQPISLNEKEVMVSEMNDIKSQVAELMRTVPSLTRRYAGRRLMTDKVCSEYADRYFTNNETAYKASLQILYYWNKFHHVKEDNAYIAQQLVDIEQIIEEENFNENNVLAHLLFHKGVCLKLIKRYCEAEDVFKQIFEIEETINKKQGIPAQTALELTILHIEQRNLSEAKYWLTKCSQYQGYWTQMWVLFKMENAKRMIKELERELKMEMMTNENNNKMKWNQNNNFGVDVDIDESDDENMEHDQLEAICHDQLARESKEMLDRKQEDKLPEEMKPRNRYVKNIRNKTKQYNFNKKPIIL